MSINKGKLLAPDPSKSIFTMKIYYNKNHVKTGTQFEWRFFSRDFETERKSKDMDFKEYNGYQYMMKMAKDIFKKGELWFGIIAWNRLLDETDKTEDGQPKSLIVWEYQVEGAEKRFTTAEEQRRYIAEGNMRKQAEEEAANSLPMEGYSFHEFV